MRTLARSTRLESAIAAALGWMSFSLMAACDFPVSTSKYHVDEERHPDVDQVVGAFAAPGSACDSCLREDCLDQLEACSSTPACPAFAECVRAGRDPAATTRCGNEQVGLEQVMAYTAVRKCFEKCFESCSVGTDWSCVGRYGAPHVYASPIRVQQQLSYVGLFAPVADARVEFCAVKGPDCVPVVPPVTTDADGSYAVDLPIAKDSGGLGWWSGTRHIQAASIYPYRLERNIPVWTHHVERTGLVTQQLFDLRVELFEKGLGVDIEPLAYFMVQIFDCQTTGAPNIVFSVPSAPNALVEYIDPRATKPGQFSATTGIGEGVAVILGVEVGREHEVVAKRADSGETVASGRVFVSGHDVVLLNLFPEPS